MRSLTEEGIEVKIGLEIHFQVKGRKLFCSCPGEEDRTNLGTFVRRLTVVSGERGERDLAAMQESAKGKVFEYIISGNSCLVEMDEEPPHPPGEETISAALLVSMMLGCRIVDNIHFMRKIVVDGSNTSGFQRTGIVGLSGTFSYNGRNIGIATVTLEEEACRKIREERGKVTYSLDRLGIPLIEVSTEPDIGSPKEAREVAEAIGFTVRRSRMIRREVSSIRQDLNISIGGGNRVEIKGVQSLSQIERVLEKEIERQKSLIAISSILRGRGEKGQIVPVDVTKEDLFRGSSLISKARDDGKRIVCFRLPALGGLLHRGGFRLGSEIAERLRAQGIGGIIHSDELPNYGITEEEKSLLFRNLGCGKDDAFGIIAVNSGEVEKGMRIIEGRIAEAFEGVPAETRAAAEDGTRFLRPLPGSSRMYPETDIPIIEVSDVYLDEVRKGMPVSIEERIAQLESLGIPAQEAAASVRKEYDDVLEDFSREFGNPKLCARFLSTVFSSEEKDVRAARFLMHREARRNIPVEALEPLYLQGSFNLPDGRVIMLEKGDKLRLLVNENGKTGEMAENFTYSTLTRQDLERIIERVLKENAQTVRERGEASFKLLMGRVMKEVRGQFAGKEISEVLRQKLDFLLKTMNSGK
ncbi:MAG: Glu-tRNA(Gln) amidotransferase subunit GatE [Thermoplasmata archaeon]